ncbi:MAG: segregation and condensation protein A [Planctomycetota bacterium]|jgi:segregation and condensation protein A
MTSGADYRVDLSIYNGPLDLLLHLIREREVDIHEIPIAEITEQFLSHIEVVKRIDVERAGDFLLMAATLMLIKSRMLLPRAEAGEDELEEELDPRTDLVNQLLEYKAFRDRSRALADAGEERLQRYEGGLAMPDPEAPDAGKLLEDLGVHDLLLAFEKLMSETLAEVDFRFRLLRPVGNASTPGCHARIWASRHRSARPPRGIRRRPCRRTHERTTASPSQP